MPTDVRSSAAELSWEADIRDSELTLREAILVNNRTLAFVTVGSLLISGSRSAPAYTASPSRAATTTGTRWGSAWSPSST